MTWTKEKQREYMREYRLKNAVKLKAKKAAHYQANKEEIAAKKAADYRANPEKKKAQDATYRLNNPEKCKAQSAAYRKNNHKQVCIRKWESRGVVLRPDETWDIVYDKYIATLNCESCDIELDDTLRITRRNLDHMHKGKWYIRGTICHSCNNRDQWRKRMTPYSTYQQYL